MSIGVVWRRSVHASAKVSAAAAPLKTLKMSVDGKEVEVDASYTVLQACECGRLAWWWEMRAA